jgi:hypothetical protein
MSFWTNRPVRGAQFVGRQQVLAELKRRLGQPIWIMGNRRVGKTSLLKQVEFLCDQNHWTDTKALYWDFQGAGSSEGLKEALLESLEDKPGLIAELGLDLAEWETLALPESLARLRRRMKSRGRFLILIDEVEELVDICRREPQVLSCLRKVQDPPHISLILCGSFRLMELDETANPTSPFLPDFLPPLMLGPFSQEESTQQLAPASLASRMVQAIAGATFGNPYLNIQLAERVLDGKTLEAAMRSLIRDKVAGAFFQSNFACLPVKYLSAWKARSAGQLLATSHPGDRDFPMLYQSSLVQARSEQAVDVSPLLLQEESGEGMITLNQELKTTPESKEFWKEWMALTADLARRGHELLCLPPPDQEVERAQWETPPHLRLLHSSGEPSGNLINLLGWATPEFVLGEKGSEPTSVYLAALWLYRHLTGQPLHPSNGDLWSMANTLAETPPPSERFQNHPSISPKLAMILAQALHPKPGQRPNHLDGFIQDIRAIVLN